ncbi:MAG: hypothetical protein EAS52_20130, partial [Parapedobacter sp.]
AGDDPNGDPVTEDSDDPGTPDPNDPTDTDVVQTPSFTVMKELASINSDAAVTTYSAVGDVLVYTITVENTGNVTLDNVAVHDALTGLNETVATLAPGDTETYTTAYTITQTDLDNGRFVNTATATGDDPGGNPVDPEDPDDGEVETPATTLPSLSFVKTGVLAVDGNTITYNFTVQNTGNVTMDDITVSDPKIEGAITVNPATLAPGEVATGTASYTVTQEEKDAGGVENLATVTGTPPTTDPVDPAKPIDPVPSTPDEDNPGTPGDPGVPTEVEVPAAPSLSLTKRATGEGPYAVGQYINFELIVKNTGNVTLTGVTVTDGNAVIVSGSPIASLAPNASATITARHQVTQEDIDNGTVVNQAKVTGDDPEGNPIPEVPSDNPDTPQPNDPTVVELTQQPGLSLTKRSTGEGPYALGDYINFEITVRNTGNVTLTDVTVTDGNAEIVSGSPIASLAPNTSATVIARHLVTQTDIDNGTVVNQAKVTGDDPEGNPIPEVPSDNPDTPQPNDPTVVELTQNPSLSL